MPQGTCKMCNCPKTLVSSHLMPASLYDYCRVGEHRPLRITDGFVLPTDKQTQTVLLCNECEGILNRDGESWITTKLATSEKTFPLYDILTTQSPIINDADTSLYFASKNPDIKVDKLKHFALGMFWKASVHSWTATNSDPKIELGPYSQAIREWLRRGAKFPEHIYLLVFMSRPHRAQISLIDPYEGRTLFLAQIFLSGARSTVYARGWENRRRVIAGALCSQQSGKSD